MKSFFERETNRLESTTQRMAVRASKKRDIDASKLDPPKKVCSVAYISLCLIDHTQEGGNSKDITSWEEKAKKEYNDYQSMELKLLIELGVVQTETNNDD